MSQTATERTIADFGEQWTRFTDNSGYYGSKQFFADLVTPLLQPNEAEGKLTAEIGSGTGRIANMLLLAGARHVTAIEPSKAFDVLYKQLAHSRQVSCVNAPGESIASLGPFDLVLSVGVLHHIPDPKPVVDAAYTSLRPGGKVFIWLYGREGNYLYLAFVLPLRALTQRMPDRLLDIFVRALDIPLASYVWLCRYLKLPMRNYMRNVIAKLTPDKRRLTIFDQLNPAYAKYYNRSEAIELLEASGFCDVNVHHRHGYSWSVVGTKPEKQD